MAFDLDPTYKQVPERLADFKEKHPDGCLRPADPSKPYWIEVIGEQTFIVYAAAAYRAPDDPTPGIGLAWEPFPGRTPYTKASELQNAETSAWGRAIVAVLASESKSVASAEDVRNRQADHAEPERQRQAPVAPPMPLTSAETTPVPHRDAASAVAIIKNLTPNALLACTLWWEGCDLPFSPSGKPDPRFLSDDDMELVLDFLRELDALGPAGEGSRPLDGGPVEPSPAAIVDEEPPPPPPNDPRLPKRNDEPAGAPDVAKTDEEENLDYFQARGMLSPEEEENVRTGGSPATARRVMDEAKARKPAGAKR